MRQPGYDGIPDPGLIDLPPVDRRSLPPRPPATAVASVLRRLRLPIRRHRANVRVRDLLLAERERLFADLAVVDAEVGALAQRRASVLGEIQAVDDNVWQPVLEHGRRRPLPGVPLLPPVAPDAVTLSGSTLREVCLGLLERHGERELRDLHGLLHTYGYQIGHPEPVKHLADMLRYEVLAGRARRVRRGTYDVAGSHRPRRHPPGLPAAPTYAESMR